MSSTNASLKHIVVSKGNYYALKKLGGAGDSFNDVITKLLGASGAQKQEGSTRGSR